MSPPVLRNWDGSVVSRPAVVVRPGSAEEIAVVLRDPRRFPSPVRPLGSHHSPTACAAAEGGTAVDMGGWNRVLRVEGTTVTAEAGARYRDVARELQRHGLQFFVNPEIGNLSLGSAACCGTKDASMPGELGQASSYVVSMKLVTPDGRLRQVTTDDETELQLLRSSYGLLGVVCEASFRVRQLAPMAVWHRSYRRDEFLACWPELRAGGESLMFYLFPHLDGVTVEFRRYRPGEPARFRGDWRWRFRNWCWRQVVPSLARSTAVLPRGRVRHGVLDGISRAARSCLCRVIRAERTNPRRQIIRFPRRAGFARYRFSFWAFPDSEFPGLLDEYYRFCREHERRRRFRCDLLNVGYRIAADTASLLSYAWQGPVVTLDPVSTGGRGWTEFLAEYNVFCSRNGGVPLLNQTPGLTAGQVRGAFGPRLDRFRAARERADPEGRLLNDYFRRLLAP